MNEYQQVEILLVEDNPNDAALTLRSLKNGNFVNKLYWVKDGQQALDFLYCTCDYAARDRDDHPRLILLDLIGWLFGREVGRLCGFENSVDKEMREWESGRARDRVAEKLKRDDRPISRFTDLPANN